jgi:hypothetical protein
VKALSCRLFFLKVSDLGVVLSFGFWGKVAVGLGGCRGGGFLNLGFCSGPAFLAPGVVWVGEGLASFSWL